MTDNFCERIKQLLNITKVHVMSVMLDCLAANRFRF